MNLGYIAVCIILEIFLKGDIERKEVDFKIKNYETILPLRLQAYERITLLLERISPNNIMLRLNKPGLSAKEFQIILVKLFTVARRKSQSVGR